MFNFEQLRYNSGVSRPGLTSVFQTLYSDSVFCILYSQGVTQCPGTKIPFDCRPFDAVFI